MNSTQDKQEYKESVKKIYQAYQNNIEDIKQRTNEAQNKEQLEKMIGYRDVEFIENSAYYIRSKNATNEQEMSAPMSFEELKQESNRLLQESQDTIKNYEQKIEPYMENKDYLHVIENSSEMKFLSTHHDNKNLTYRDIDLEDIEHMNALNFKLDINKELKQDLRDMNKNWKNMSKEQKMNLTKKINNHIGYLKGSNLTNSTISPENLKGLNNLFQSLNMAKDMDMDKSKIDVIQERLKDSEKFIKDMDKKSLSQQR